ncbi:hypothetical protein QEV83_15425 [Methylocapsa sp. D3K7]|uniref:hypothetical protein n=1 Tax=Methylocapsa sp. D3K7 TaxID=3041435 RepID=UPI00244E8F4D|nr:hypothetical protein [Methylocapsa sp. D3K7]WGJ14034.1 hypothetical protein QEV83_15425 [Methylocapsa sp. D3K7]
MPSPIFGFAASKDIYNVSITFFGIFAALLLNLQVAAFGIFQRKWEIPGDQKMAEMQESTLKIRRVLLKEINSNISYLILVSSVAIIVFLLLYITDWKSALPSALAVCLYWHFILTLLMIIKRSHALFQREYKSDN